MTVSEHKNLHFDNEKNVHLNSKKMRKVAMALIWIWIHLVLIVCFHISGEVG